MLCVVFFYDYDYARIGNEKKTLHSTLFCLSFPGVSVLGDRKENIALNFHLNFMSHFGQEPEAFIVSALVPLPVLLDKDKVHNMI